MNRGFWWNSSELVLILIRYLLSSVLCMLFFQSYVFHIFQYYFISIQLEGLVYISKNLAIQVTDRKWLFHYNVCFITGFKRNCIMWIWGLTFYSVFELFCLVSYARPTLHTKNDPESSITLKLFKQAFLSLYLDSSFYNNLV